MNYPIVSLAGGNSVLAHTACQCDHNRDMAIDTPASRNADSVQRFGFLLIPAFSLIALSSAVDPLRLANMALGRRAFEWVTVGLRDEPVLSSGGIRVLPDQVMGESSRFDTVFVIGPNPLPKHGYGDTTRWLRQLEAQGVTLGGIDTGSYYLAKAGLLNGYRCTIHWEDRETLVEEFPEAFVSSRLFEIDRDRYTCSGGVSPLDLMTFVLRRPPGGRELAQQVSTCWCRTSAARMKTRRCPCVTATATCPRYCSMRSR